MSPLLDGFSATLASWYDAAYGLQLRWAMATTTVFNGTTTNATLVDYCGPEGFGPISTDEDRQPDFTPCFEDTVILMIPKAILLLFGTPFFLGWLRLPLPPVKTFSWVYWTKLALIVAAMGVTLANLVLLARDPDDPYPYLLVSAGTTLFVQMVVLVFHYVEFYRRYQSSGVLLLFWLFMIFANIFKIRTEILIGDFDYDFVLLCVAEGIYVAIFVLENFPKPEATYAHLKESPKPCAEMHANFFSVLTFWWLNPFMVLGYKRPLEEEDLFDLPPQTDCQHLSEVFQENWQKELKKQNPSFVRALAYSYGGSFLFAAVFKLAQDLLAFVQPLLLDKLIVFIESYAENEVPEPMYRGYLISFGMLITAFAQTLFLHQYFHRCFVTGMKVRAGIIAAIYEKSLKLSSSARQESTVGEIVNHMAIDAQRLMDWCSYAHILWSGPLQIALALYFLYAILGPATFAGLLILIALIPINSVIAAVMRNMQKVQMGNKDARIKIMDEILNGMKVIKLYAWEMPFFNKVDEARTREINMLRKISYVVSFASFLWAGAPILVSIATFGLYAIDNALTSDVAFVSLSLFNLLQFPMSMFPSVITSTVEASVAVNRIFKFLTSEELDVHATTVDDADATNGSSRPDSKVAAVRSSAPPRAVIENGSFSWNAESSSLALKEINLRVENRELVAIVGRVGEGKSSLISSLLGEMNRIGGRVYLRGSVAYVPQQPWIMNSSLRENILFGRKYDEHFYKAVIHASALQPDLDILPDGDLTEIGENGINLSGGQKQRVSLARAVYSGADIYLLDDPLSAVDVHVGNHIFQYMLGHQGLLKEKTRLLVTHGMQYLSKVDKIVVMEDGRIREMGSYAELQEASGDLKRLLDQFGVTWEGEDEDDEDNEGGGEEQQAGGRTPGTERRSSKGNLLPEGSINTSAQDVKKIQEPSSAKLIEKEGVEVGNVKYSVYRTYLEAMGLWAVGVMLAMFLMGQVFYIGSSLWLSYWSAQETTEDTWLYVSVYAAFGFGTALVTLGQAIFTTVVCGIHAAIAMHTALILNVIRLPMSFFDTTPLGRVLNRFSKDQNTIDETLPRNFQQYFRTMFSVIGILVVITYSTWYFIIAVVPLGVLYFYVQRYYIETSRQLKRLESISRSPIYARFGETLQGVTSIRAYKQQSRFIEINEQLVDRNHTAYYPNIASNRWLAVRLEFVGSLIVFLSAFLGVLMYATLNPGGTAEDAAVVGMSVSFALSITQTLNWMVRMSCDLENNVVSVERVKEYTQVETEAPAVIDNNRPGKDWPQKGVVKFSNYSTRYRDHLDLVLKNIDCTIAPVEKVGVVGRTGAGKSSLSLALFRIIEPATGTIYIDDVDIAKIGLDDLRSKLTIIPQDPVLFGGSIRDNLDPFCQYDDEQIWAALGAAHLKDHIMSLESKLDHRVAQHGENFSVGQRQLICLARALLRKTKILVLDEATASVDIETDALIQKTVREEFSACTIITIAHRLNTILDSDRIMVLEQGYIREFDSPANLLKESEGLFYSLVKEAGLLNVGGSSSGSSGNSGESTPH